MSARPEDFLAHFSDDCVWTVGGSSAIAGTYRGHDGILAFFGRLQELTENTYRVEPPWELSDGDHGVFYYRAHGVRPDGRTIDLDQALVCSAGPDGRYAEVRALPFDQDVFDAFWA